MYEEDYDGYHLTVETCEKDGFWEVKGDFSYINSGGGTSRIKCPIRNTFETQEEAQQFCLEKMKKDIKKEF